MANLRVSFGITGLISKFPYEIKTLIEHLMEGGADVYIISDIKKPPAAVAKLLQRNDLAIAQEKIVTVDTEQEGDRGITKALQYYGIDIHFDANPAHCHTNKLITFFVWPNNKLDPFHPDFKMG